MQFDLPGATPIAGSLNREEPRSLFICTERYHHQYMTLIVAAFLLQAVQAPANVVAGRAVDASGRPLSEVVVSLNRVPSETLQTANTDACGVYRFDAVPDGTYAVSFQTPGFKKTVRQNVVVRGKFESRVNVRMEPSQIQPDRGPVPVVTTRATSTTVIDPAFRTAGVLVCVHTAFGTIDIEVHVKRAPNTAANFLKYVDAGLYDGGRFHRATRPDNYKPAPPNRPAMELIQGGINPEKKGQGFPAIPLERTSATGIKHVRGVVSMARGGPDTATSDFFILLDDQPSLDFGGLRFDDAQGAAAFGTVVAGLDVVTKIQQQPVQGQNLTPPVAILSVRRIQK